jgi:hypothetical protein
MPSKEFATPYLYPILIDLACRRESSKMMAKTGPANFQALVTV